MKKHPARWWSRGQGGNFVLQQRKKSLPGAEEKLLPAAFRKEGRQIGSGNSERVSSENCPKPGEGGGRRGGGRIQGKRGGFSRKIVLHEKQRIPTKGETDLLGKICVDRKGRRHRPPLAGEDASFPKDTKKGEKSLRNSKEGEKKKKRTITKGLGR